MELEKINVMDLNDFLDHPLKVYPYQITNQNQAKSFVEENSFSVVNIVNNSNKPLKKDKNERPLYFEVIPQFSETGELIAKNTSIFGELFQTQLQIECFASNLPTSFNDNEKFEVDGFDLQPYIFTINEPYNAEKYRNNEQEVFVVEESINIMDGQNDLDVLIKEGYQETTFINFKEIIKKFDKVKVIFYENIQNVLDYPKLVYSASDQEFSGFKIYSQNHMLLSMSKGIICKGIDGNDNFMDFPLSSWSALTPFKATPISTNNQQVELFMDWFDYDVVSTLEIISKFKTAQSLEVIFNFTEDIICILDMLAIAYAYATQFVDFPRYESGADIGKLKPENTIGSLTEYSISDVASTNPSVTLSNVFKRWLLKTALQEDDSRAQLIKNCLALLSKYIGGNYAIGGSNGEGVAGASAFNEIYLPWYLKLNNPLSLLRRNTSSGNNFYCSTSTQFIAESRYFIRETSQSDFSPPTPRTDEESQIYFHKTKLVQTDRKLSLPAIPEEIESIDKLPLPSDIDIQSNNDLKYLCYLPISDENNFKKLFLNEARDVASDERKTFNLNWTTYGFGLGDQTNVDNLIKSQASSLYQVSKDQIVILNRGNKEERWSSVKTYYNKRGHDDYWSILASGLPTGLHDIAGGARRGYDLDSLSELQDLTDLHLYSQESFPYQKPYYRWTDFTEWSFSVDGRGYGRGQYTATEQPTYYYTGRLQARVWHEAKYQLKSERHTDVQIQITGTYKFIPLRTAIFTKGEWKKFLTNLNLFDQTEIHNDIQCPDFTIKRIQQIEIGSMWGEYIKIEINHFTFKIDLFQKDDETIGRQKILFI